ncbi:O-acetylhomoserine aminocarboxypropyltransferase/cysteine synthase [Christensenellaceae bacterium OttesenSCG-928-K19]|nr:O-acetylhomoserine aminocarboxypropyltransferase/cysteine synthase [Christensenellaceae bacterium OttesenSCG-928-K19]
MTKIDTKCVTEGYKAKSGEPFAMPIYQSTTYEYDSTEHIGDLFDLKKPGYFYTRLANPTVGFVEEKIAAMEGGVGAMITSSGQAASLIALLNIADAGDHFVSSSTIYGGTFNLFNVTLRKLGIDVTFVDPEANEEEISKAFKKNTKGLFGETIANPAIKVLDIEKFARIAKKHDVPLLIDNTFATPILCRPIEHGADIVLHSTTKYMDGHAVQVGGVIVDSGNFNWDNGKYPGLSTPDDSYHGVTYTKNFGKAAYITKARTQLMRDLGACPTAEGAFLIDLGLQTLALRMERHCANAQKVAEFLAAQDSVVEVGYPGLRGDKYYDMAQKYLPDGSSGVIMVRVKGGRQGAVRFMDSLEMIALVVHVAMNRTCALHPASATHRQMTDEQLIAAGITPDLIRLSVGIENAEDIIADLKQALDQAVQ